MKSTHSAELVSPYMGSLVTLDIPGGESAEEWKAYAGKLPSIQISYRSVCDLELLATGAFSPLDRFMCRDDYERVVAEMRLSNGILFPIPVTLPVAPSNSLKLDSEIALRTPQNEILAILNVEEIYEWQYEVEVDSVYGTRDTRHPMVSEMCQWGPLSLSGTLQMLSLPRHFDFKSLRLQPSETRQKLAALGHKNVVAFQTRNPMHRSHEEATRRATERVNGALFIHPTVGVTRPGDIDYFTRVRCIRSLVQRYSDPAKSMVSIFPLAMRMAGPREALWHMIIRKNYGASHFIIGRDHASPGKDSQGKPIYDPYAAQELAAEHAEEIGVQPVTINELVYVEDEDRYEEVDQIPAGKKVLSISGTELRDEYLSKGKMLPEWYTRPEVARILMQAYPPKQEQGFCVWFTGLPSAGKSTVAEILVVKLYEAGKRVSFLDGDIVRTHLSKGLGFSREDRDANILRIGFVSWEIVRHNGIVISAAVSPYRSTRDQVRSMFANGNFIEVHVNTPIEVCERRDVKGLYAKARRGELQGFTGIDDPYEDPIQPEIVIDTTRFTPEQSATAIYEFLQDRGFIHKS